MCRKTFGKIDVIPWDWNTARKTEGDVEGEDKPVGEKKEGNTKAVVLRANKRPIHDSYAVTRTAKDTMTGKWTCSHMHIHTRRVASITSTTHQLLGHFFPQQTQTAHSVTARTKQSLHWRRLVLLYWPQFVRVNVQDKHNIVWKLFCISES